MEPKSNQVSEESLKLAQWLEANPEVGEPLRTMIEEVGAERAGGLTLEEAEEKMVLGIRQIGQSLLTRWAQAREEVEGKKQAAKGRHRHGKKNCGC